MSDPVLVGMMASAATVVCSVVSAVVLIRGHRHHEQVSKDTQRVVTEIRVSTNGQLEKAHEQLEKALGKIAELESVIRSHILEK